MTSRSGYFSFGFKLFLYILAGFALSDLILYYITDHNLGKSYYDAMVVLDTARNATFRLTVTVFALINLAMLWLVFLTSLVMSHRVSGPMYRFEKTTDSLAEGDMTVCIRLREKDYMKAQAESYNEAVSGLRERISSAKSAAAELGGRLAALRETLDADDAGKNDVTPLIKEMKSANEKVGRDLSFFEVV